MQNRSTESNVQPSEDEASEVEETEDTDLVVGKNISVEEIMENADVEERRQSHKKFKKNPKTENFGSSLLKILENRQTIPEDPEKSFLMSLLPQIRTLDEEQKTQLYIEFLNAIQRVKNSYVTPTYPTYNAPNNQPYSQFFPQQHYATNNHPQSISSSISYQRPLSHMSQFNISPHQYTSQNSPKNISSTITSPPIVNDESSNFSQPSPSEMYSAQKQNYYNS
ncbi:uncharacterized protein LOC126550231 [Aphis gossypii]|nr:uncharacterized protein LOC126550231 [Aphis gossypii]